MAWAVVFGLAGCHRNNNPTSGYGIEYVTLTSEPAAAFAAYRVNVNLITVTRSDGVPAYVLQTPETVDLTKLGSVAELVSAATFPIGSYTSASITIDYTNADIEVIVNGRPVRATPVDSTGAPLTTTTLTQLVQIVNVVLDPATAYEPTVLPTFATSAAQRLAIDFNLAASTASINLNVSPPTVTVRPYLTAAIAPADTKAIRVRGPLVNSNADIGTYSVYVRPFFDEASDLGRLTLFTSPTTVFAINGTVSTGTPGITQLSQTSTGSSVTAAYTTFTPTPTPTAAAGVFNVVSVIAGSTLEDLYTQGLEGDVIARNGNVLTLQGPTLFLYNGSTTGATAYLPANASVTVGPSTMVTADGVATHGLDYNSIAVGQHIIVRGLCTEAGTSCTSPVVLDATSANTVNTGSVRLIPSKLYGAFTAAAAGGFIMNLQTINNFPVADYVFAGNGSAAANDPVAANFLVNSGALALPAVAALDPIFVDGLFPPFASAPPDFDASAVNSEASVQLAGQASGATAASLAAATPTLPPTCALANSDCVAASMQVAWNAPGTASPFAALSATGLTVDLANAALATAVIVIGPESLDMKTLAASPMVIPTALPAPVTATANVSGALAITLPPTFLPEYSYGNPLATTLAAEIHVQSSFATFAANAPAAITAAPALQFEARGTYDRASNTFYALTANVVL